MTDATATATPATAARPTTGKGRRALVAVLLAAVAVLIAVVVVSPIALSSNDLLKWAGTGLGLSAEWPWLVFIALDAAAGVCVLLSLYCAVRGKSAGAFGIGVWVFAGFSAVANYRHGIQVIATAPDAWWFFPAMSVLGPALLEAVTWLIRREIQKTTGARSADRIKFGLLRWLPVVGAPRDTYGAYRTAQILQIATVDEAVRTYHALCPDGTVRVVRAIRGRDVAAAATTAREADRLAREATKATVRPLAVASTAPTSPAPTGADRLNGHRPAAATSGPSRATVRAAIAASGHPTNPAGHTPLAVADAATIRSRYPDGLPDRGAQRKVREELGWHAGKATNALNAWRDGVDLSDMHEAGNAPNRSGDPATRSGPATGPATP